MKTCPTCKGAREIPGIFHMWGSGSALSDPQICPTCNGSGMVDESHTSFSWVWRLLILVGIIILLVKFC